MSDTMAKGMTMTVHFTKQQVLFMKAVIGGYKERNLADDRTDRQVTKEDLDRELQNILDRLDGKVG